MTPLGLSGLACRITRACRLGVTPVEESQIGIIFGILDGYFTQPSDIQRWREQPHASDEWTGRVPAVWPASQADTLRNRIHFDVGTSGGQMTPVQIARIGYEAVRAYNATHDLDAFPTWDEVDEDTRYQCIEMVNLVTSGAVTTPDEMCRKVVDRPFADEPAHDQMRVLITFEVARACNSNVPRDPDLMDPALDSVGEYPVAPTLDWAGEDIDGSPTSYTEEECQELGFTEDNYCEPSDPTGGPNNDD